METESIHRSPHLVLRDDVAEEVVAQFAQDKLGWPLRNRRQEDRDEWFPYQVSWYIGPNIQLHYTEDMLSDVKYVQIAGEDPKVVQATTEMTETVLNTLRSADILWAVAEAPDPEEMAYAVHRAGIAAPREFDEAFFRALTTAMRNDSLMVREASVWAVTYRPWKAYLEPLTRLAEIEPDEDLAHTARLAVEEFRANMTAGDL